MTETLTKQEKIVRRARVKLVALSIALVTASAIDGCGQPAANQKRFNSTAVASNEFGTDFELIDHTGKVRKLSEFRGKVVTLFFGYTHCPDACPTALTELAAIRKRLGNDGNRLQVLFVTVDPERDTREVLRGYATAFDPSFVGLYADAETTGKVASDFKVFHEKIPGSEATNYTIDHSVYTYAFDARGRLRLLMPPTEPLEQKLADIRALLAGA